jgi:hypothetical protein
MSDFADEVQKAVQKSIIDTLAKGDWLTVEWRDKMSISQERLREIYAAVDMDKVANIVKEKVEKKLADAIFNALATEVATDVKKIMSNTELREDCRASIRLKIRAME